MKKWFSSFGFKIVFLISISSFMTVAVVAGSFFVINAAEKKLMVANEERAPMLQLSNQMAANLSSADRFYWNSIAEADAMATIRLAGLAGDEITSFDNNLTNLKKINLTTQEKEVVKSIEEKWNSLKADYLVVNTESEKGTKEGFAAAKTKLIGSKKNAEAITETITKLNEELSKVVKAEVEQDHTDIAKAKKIMLGMSIATLLSLVLVCFMALNAGKQLSRTLGEVISHLKSSSHEVELASQNLSTSASQLSSESKRTAKSVEETVAFAQEVTTMVFANAESAKQAAVIAAGGKEEAKVGEDKMMKLYEAVMGLAKSSKQIEEMVTVIDDIAFQTNILALNAAVEAARAGEQGKGFAVVADAVRSLAQKSAVAAKDITSMIQSSVSQIETSSRLADEGKQSLTEIVNSIMQISDLNTKIANASEEQASSLKNISNIMNEIDRSSQDNVGATEKIFETSEELNAQSLGLNEQIEGLAVLAGVKNKAA